MAKAKKQPTTERIHPVSVTHYHEAIQQHFGWAPSEYEFEEYSDGPVLVKHKNSEEVYQVDNAYDISQRAREMLTRKEAATWVKPEWCPELMENVHTDAEFYWHLLPELSDKAIQLTQLQTALSISQVAREPIRAFWYSLHQLGEFDIYSAAIIAAAETYSLDALVGELTEFLATEEELVEMQDGIFETIVLASEEPESPVDDTTLFYIYTKDPAVWQVK